jgi:pimeloyl-ACP methyl ester esterase
MPFVTHAGVTLRYDRTGAGPAVLLVHGWLGNRTFWERQVHALRDRFTVVTVDLRGHGESSAPRTGYGVAALATDLEQVVRILGVPHVAVVGWSLGGVVAQQMALRLGDRVSHLVLVCTTPGGLMAKDNPRAQPERSQEIRARVAADFRAFAREFAPNLFHAGADSPLLAWATGQLQKTPANVALACFDGLLAADLRDRLGDLRVPTAVLHGRHDRLLALAEGEALAKAIPGAKLTVFEQSGHSPQLEEPEPFNAALIDFLTATHAPPAAAPTPTKTTTKKTPPKRPPKATATKKKKRSGR